MLIIKRDNIIIRWKLELRINYKWNSLIIIFKLNIEKITNW